MRMRSVATILSLALALPLAACETEEEPFEDEVLETEEVTPGIVEDEGLVEENGIVEDEGL